MVLSTDIEVKTCLRNFRRFSGSKLRYYFNLVFINVGYNSFNKQVVPSRASLRQKKGTARCIEVVLSTDIAVKSMFTKL